MGADDVPQRVLPDFERPPVVEVAVGVEFIPLPQLRLAQMIAFHESWKDTYPKLQEQSALPPSRQPGTVLAGIGLHIGEGVEPLRLWMLTEDEHTLIQLQHDRLFLNWRRLGSEADYPRYANLREEFARLWSEFATQIQSDALGEIQPSIADVTFVNRIHSPAGRSDLSNILVTVTSPPADMPGNLVMSRVQYVLDTGGNHGRPAHMVITAGPEEAASEDVSLQIVTRVSLGGDEPPDRNEILSSLDHAHDIGVLGFTSISTPSMHQVWGRTA